MIFDLRIPESMAALPSRTVRASPDIEPPSERRLPVAKRVTYATDEERREARRRTWRAYAARNRRERVASTQRWRAQKRLCEHGDPLR